MLHVASHMVMLRQNWPSLCWEEIVSHAHCPGQDTTVCFGTLLSGRRGRPWFTTVANCCWQQMDVTVTRAQGLGGALRSQMLCLQSGSCTDVGSKSPGRPLIP